MDLGLQGRRAIVCAASKGLGRACATSLAHEGVTVIITGRDEETLQKTARAIAQETGTDVQIAPGDIATEAGRAAAIAGGPPPGDFRDWDREDWLRALDANMLAPIALMKAVIDGMIGRRFGRIVNITSGSVKSPIAQLGMSNGARAGLTGFTAGLARQVARHNVTINNLLPGSFVTDRLRTTMKGAAAQSGRTIEEEMAARAEQNPSGRFGDPEEFGRACAFLCAASSGYIVGQNLLLDGGAFNATLS
jgi:3-oxoacyl-[acyl-carrier protein] reductase